MIPETGKKRISITQGVREDGGLSGMERPKKKVTRIVS